MQRDLFSESAQLPAQQHSATSVEAASRAREGAQRLRMRVLAFIAGNGGFGATDNEAQVALRMAGNTERPRRVELVAAGLVEDSGRTRTTRAHRRATVWIATEKAHRLLGNIEADRAELAARVEQLKAELEATRQARTEAA